MKLLEILINYIKKQKPNLPYNLTPGSISQFFKDEIGHYSMIRLITFIVVVTLCFDAFWSLVVMKTAWELTTAKLFFGVTAMGGKISEKAIMNLGLAKLPLPTGADKVVKALTDATENTEDKKEDNKEDKDAG